MGENGTPRYKDPGGGSGTYTVEVRNLDNEVETEEKAIGGVRMDLAWCMVKCRGSALGRFARVILMNELKGRRRYSHSHLDSGTWRRSRTRAGC